jgi:hypothetical protein
MKRYLFSLACLFALLSINAQNAATKVYSLNFDVKNYTVEKAQLNGKTIVYRSFKNVVYVSNPVDAKYECMNVFIPEAYFKGKSVNGYNKDTAPIFLPNNVGGYMPATPGTVKMEGRPGGMPGMPEMRGKFPMITINHRICLKECREECLKVFLEAHNDRIQY